MTSYRRRRLPGGTFFFSVMLAQPGGTLLTDRIAELRRAYALTCRERPFRTEAIVVLPDHLHAVWTLPPGDSDYSARWRLIKGRFSHALGCRGARTASKRRRGERGIWQRRFWEHTLRDAADLDLHCRYCWVNPVLHGLAETAGSWPFSSVRRDDPALARLGAREAAAFRGAFGEFAAGRRMGDITHPAWTRLSSSAR
ncbi:REP-associated tyrosine transposase [Oceaniglobus roseus]|uniref:REP-associated tyrosine transposase n=1 Tax=Oceaniglobus roseus TaxID=1737570 RepID=UPI001FE48723|nr:transposase [Kandeliimicrobium roseum]